MSEESSKELVHTIIAVILFALILSFNSILGGSFHLLGLALVFSLIVISINILSKKAMASKLDAAVYHEIWEFQRYGFKPGKHYKNPVKAGVIFPVALTIITLGILKPASFLTYDTSALRRRAAKRHGHYSFTEMTDWHTALIGASGIFSVLLIAFVSYFIPLNSLDLLTKAATFYAFWNLLPISKLDGAQIYFGSRVLWTVLAAITAIFTVYAVLLI